MSEGGIRRSEIRDQMTEIGDWRSDDGSQARGNRHEALGDG